jgi:hypothetical protein
MGHTVLSAFQEPFDIRPDGTVHAPERPGLGSQLPQLLFSGGGGGSHDGIYCQLWTSAARHESDTCKRTAERVRRQEIIGVRTTALTIASR